MKRLLITAAVATAGLVTATPAVAGLAGNPSFSHRLPVRVPSQAQVMKFDDRGPLRSSPVLPVSASRSPEPGDDRGGASASRSPEPGDDRGGASASRSPEPGDDRGGASASRSPEPGDDRGGDGGSGHRSGK